jgi:hypothetical protein
MHIDEQNTLSTGRVQNFLVEDSVFLMHRGIDKAVA